MANTFVYTDWVSREPLRLLKNMLQVSQFFNKKYQPEYRKEFAVGDTIRVKLPQEFTTRTGLGYSPQNLTRINTTITVDQVFGIDFEYDSIEEALKMERTREEFKEQYMMPAMAQLAQEIDSRCALFAYQNTPNIVGVLGTNPSAFSTIGSARQKLIEMACPPSGKKGIIIPPVVNQQLANTSVGYFQPPDEISKIFKSGAVGRNSGFDFYESMSLYRHTAGTWAGAVTVNGNNQAGSSLAVTCTTGDTFNQGDVIAITNVLPVNPKTRRTYAGAATANYKQFVITQATTGAASAATLQISPPIYGPGSQYQNVDALPVTGATITLFPGTTTPNGLSGIQALALHQDAFFMVGVPMAVPKAVEIGSQSTDEDSGISLRFVRQFDPIESKMVNRYDVLMGFGVGYNQSCAVRMLCG